LSRGDATIRKKLILDLADQDDRRGVDMLKNELEAELGSSSRDFSHWMWLSTYLDYYLKKKDVRIISRFFPLVPIAESDIGFKIIEAIRAFKMKNGISFLIKAAELSQSPHNNQEYAIAALGELGGKESIEPLKRISRRAGAVCRRYAKEAIEKIRHRK